MIAATEPKANAMRAPRVLLLSMPWDQLEYPSIQLGILLAVLERAGVPAEVRSLNLDFMEHCLQATAAHADDDRLSISSYHAVVMWSRDVSLGDWIFSTALRSPAPADEDDLYLEFLRRSGVPEDVIGVALRFRSAVPSFLERIAEEVADAAPAIVGFTTAFNQTLPSLALATAIRARLGDAVRIVFGGANCEGPMGAALHRVFPIIDVVVRGEGERVLPDLAVDLLAGRPLRSHPGLCYRERDGDQIVVPEAPDVVSLDEVPTPRYDEYFQRLGRTSFAPRISRDVTILYESARGCWWGERSHCSFCGISDHALSFRAKSPERVLTELAQLARRHGRLDFFFVDYILNRAYFDDLLPQLRDAGHDLRIFCETKANLRRAEVRLLREAGFTAIQAGVESLSTPVLKLMHKGVTALQNLRLLKSCAEYGVRLYWNLLFGIPGEPPEEYEAMTDLVPSLAHLEPPRLVPLQLDRFSPYFEDAASFGIVPHGPRRDFRFVYPRAHVDDADLEQIAYSFEFHHEDGRDPDVYTAELQRAVREWQATGRGAIGTLRYRRGPGFLTVVDRRPTLEPAEYHLGEAEACIYLACEDGATTPEALRALRVTGSTESADDVERFLKRLVDARLACRVDGRYLALALPSTPRTAMREQRSEAQSEPPTVRRLAVTVPG
ncbi:MAG TPA: RiPP maturation radical SAM C-methyltransferase [Solirubrobacteraceae bacterium]|nr:RiPP maturation radical SAM C-methyltransferase [Solirubrobacteraceae bacterium]